MGAVPPGLHGRTRPISPKNGEASQRLAELIEEEVLAKDPHASLDVPLDAYLENGSNYETVRLIALSDSVLGRDENYDVLFDSALEAIREHPGTYVAAFADTFWEFLVQKPLREDIGPRASRPRRSLPLRPSSRTASPFRIPQATVLLVGVPYGFVWCASDYIDSCTLEDPSAGLGRPATPGALPRDRRAGPCLGRRASDARGVDAVTEILNRITPRFPTPPLWLAVGLVALVCASPARVADDPPALGRGVPRAPRSTRRRRASRPSSRCPLYPIFIVAALGALAGDRGPRPSLASIA